MPQNYTPEGRIKQRERCRNWYRQNRAYKLKKDSDYGKSHREEKRKYERERYWKKRKQILYRLKKFRDLHPERHRSNNSKRRALRAGASINLKNIKSWIAAIKSKKTAICYYCQKRVSSRSIHFDHIIALSKGGSHSVENLCVSCSDCNLRKNSKSVTAWVRVGQQFLTL